MARRIRSISTTSRALLSDDERLIRDTVARFVDREVTPIIADCFAAERFPDRARAAARRARTVRRDHRMAMAAPGSSYTAYGLICEELERGDSSVRSCVSVQSSLVMGAIHAVRLGRAARRTGCRSSRAATKLGCFALTESHGGSDPARMRTRARRRGGDWTLDGAKHLDHERRAGRRRRRLGDDRRRRQRVPRREGHERVRVARHQEQAVVACLEHGRARVHRRHESPRARACPKRTDSKRRFSCLDDARFGIAWGACGAARACIDTVAALHAIARAVRPPA